MKFVIDNYCFGCGQDNKFGLKIEFETKPNKASAKYVIRKEYQGWPGTCHGGIVGTILDEAGVYALFDSYDASENKFVTAEMKVRYKKPVPTEEEILIEAEVVKSFRNLYFVNARISHKGELCAYSESKFFKLKD